MTKEELVRVLDLQRKAYNLLLWIDEQARHQADLLSDENVAAWKYADSCQSWVRQMSGIFPRDFRTEENDISAFSHLMPSFFNTSFHVEEKTVSKYSHSYDSYIADKRVRLVAGVSSTRKTKAQKEKTLESARHLQFIALEELAIENDCDLSREQLENLTRKIETSDALNIYSYAHELMRRSQFASQGAAVHSLWQSMDKKTRQKLNAETIWQARETLVAALNRRLES